MASKFELSSYLANLASIMTEQDRSGGVMRSKELGEEYHRIYDQLKEIIADETRTSDNEQYGEHQTGADLSRGEPSRRV